MQPSDDELMLRCRQGDAQAFEVLVRRWQREVSAVLRRLTPSNADAEDLAQEAFLRVLTGCRRYRAQGEFGTWLYRIVLNLARDAARRRRHVQQPLEPAQAVDGNGSPDRHTQQRETQALVEEALATLPDPQREILVLKHYGDLTFARIAAVLGEPESTVKSRAQAGLRRLHGALKQRGITGGVDE